MGVGNGIGNILWALACTGQVDPVDSRVQRSQLGMGFHVKPIRTLAQLEEVSQLMGFP